MRGVDYVGVCDAIHGIGYDIGRKMCVHMQSHGGFGAHYGPFNLWSAYFENQYCGSDHCSFGSECFGRHD